MNYGNRNASSPYTTKDMLLGYTAAVSSSVGLSLGLQKACKNMTKNLKGGNLVLANCAISYIAVASAGFLNSYCMRMGEMERGIKVFDEASGEEMGISKNAARKAVIQTASSRIVLSFPTFCIPGVAMAVLDRLGMIPKARVPKTILDIGVIGVALYIALPFSVSLFPQKGTINAELME